MFNRPFDYDNDTPPCFDVVVDFRINAQGDEPPAQTFYGVSRRPEVDGAVIVITVGKTVVMYPLDIVSCVTVTVAED